MQILSISLAYVLPIAMLALLLTGKGQPSRKWTVVILVALPVFYALHYQLLSALQGWASDAPLPAEFQLIAYDVAEPAPGAGDGGRILLWVRDLETPKQPPRVHRLGYTRVLHESLVNAGARQKQGEVQVGRRTTRSGRHDNADAQGPSISFNSQQPSRLPGKPD